ncbi:FAD binding domain-containing protein [Dichotomocladium elegans]|nr:FAD binding domain-containing protein [Dichotomocladium elegans]
MPTEKRNNNVPQYDVLIVGGGPSGLYAALLLASMHVSVRIIEKKPPKSSTNPSVLLSPHTIQYLHALGLADALIENGGMRHWRFQTYLNEGMISVERQSYRVWEKRGAEFNWAMSVDSNDLVQVLHDALVERTNVRVEYNHELMDMQDIAIETRQNVDYPVIATIKNHSSGRSFCSRSRIVIGADGVESFVRRKLGCTRQSRRTAFGNLYTLHIEADGNFPGLRALSIVRKQDDAVMLIGKWIYMPPPSITHPHSALTPLFSIGHRKELYIVLEEKPDWRQLALQDSDCQLLAAIEAHVQYVLQPYDIQFNRVISLRRWKANDGVSDKWSMHRRYFLVGSAMQRPSPAELLSVNLGFDSIQNLCWKLSLCLRQFASPHILDTYEAELAAHARDYHAVSDTLLSLLNPVAYKLPKDNSNDDKITTSSRNIAKLRIMQYNSWFIGTSAYPRSSIAQKSTHAAMSGKLKPYTAQQLTDPSAIRLSRSLSTSTCSFSTNLSSSTLVSRPPSQNSGLSRSKSMSMLHVRQRSFSAGCIGAPTGSGGGNTPASIFRSKTKVQTRGYQHYEPDSVVVAPHSDRWRLIRANHYSLFDRIVTERSPGSFTLVVFCTAIHSCQQALQMLGQYLDSPSSITQYEHTVSHAVAEPTLRPTSRSISHTSSIISKHRYSSSSSSPRSLGFGSRLLRFFSSWSSSSLTTISTEEPRPPLPFLLSKPKGQVMHPLSAEKAPDGDFRLFSIIYITSSSRQQASQFLSETMPGTIRSMFPRGLDHVYFDHDNQTHSLYSISEPTVVVIRPDNYIGTRIKIPGQVERLSSYFDTFLIPPVDLDSAAADVAADFCL